MPYNTIQINFVCKLMISNIKNCTSNTPKVKNCLKTNIPLLPIELFDVQFRKITKKSSAHSQFISEATPLYNLSNCDAFKWMLSTLFYYVSFLFLIINVYGAICWSNLHTYSKVVNLR